MPIAGDDTPGAISPELADLLRRMLLGEPAPNPNTPPDDIWGPRDEELPWSPPLSANAIPPRPDVWWDYQPGEYLPDPIPGSETFLPEENQWEPEWPVVGEPGYEYPAPREPRPDATLPKPPSEWDEDQLWQDLDFSTLERNVGIGGGATLVGLLAMLLSKFAQTSSATAGGIMGVPSSVFPPQGRQMPA